MATPIKPLFAVVPAKVYAPSKPLFASESIEALSVTTDDLEAINSDLKLSQQQLNAARFDISQMNMKSTNLSFIDDIGIGNQMAIPILSDWTARTSTGKLFIDTRSSMTRIHELTSRGAGSGIGGKIMRLVFKIDESPVDSDVSREVEWMAQTASQRSTLSAQIAAKLDSAARAKDGLATSVATCRGMLSKSAAYPDVNTRIQGKVKSLQLSYVICQQLIEQLGNLLDELKQVETSIKSLSLNLVPAWDVNRSLNKTNA